MFVVYYVFAQIISPTTLFLAAKVEEQPRKLEHVIKVAHACLNPQEPPLDTKSNVSSATGLKCLDLPRPSDGIPVVFIGRVSYIYLAVLNNHGNQGRLKLNCPGLPLHPVKFTVITEPFAPSFWPFKLGYRRLHRSLDSLQICGNDCLSNFRHTSSKLKSW